MASINSVDLDPVTNRNGQKPSTSKPQTNQPSGNIMASPIKRRIKGDRVLFYYAAMPGSNEQPYIRLLADGELANPSALGINGFAPSHPTIGAPAHAYCGTAFNRPVSAEEVPYDHQATLDFLYRAEYESDSSSSEEEMQTGRDRCECVTIHNGRPEVADMHGKHICCHNITTLANAFLETFGPPGNVDIELAEQVLRELEECHIEHMLESEKQALRTAINGLMNREK